MLPIDLAIDETFGFLAGVLPPAPARILDVGSGAGDLAVKLYAHGYRVTALDKSPEAGALSTEAGVPTLFTDFLEYEGGPHDVVLFSSSLHHIYPLTEAVERAHRLLEPGGVLTTEEFARERADAETARWYFETRELLEAAGLCPPVEHAEPLPSDPLERWHAAHAHIEEHPLHTGEAMLAAIRDRFDRVKAQDSPYLYRRLAEAIEPNDLGYRVTQRVLEIERRRIGEGSLVAIGLRIVARRDQ
ncbi:MAG: class I SAM-dependent methyltransferase [Chloroflexota bacterium]|nr:MAG: hypothetical protein DLM70_11045 [Chloroflexota bacterium]